jgi:hypothetical protein
MMGDPFMPVDEAKSPTVMTPGQGARQSVMPRHSLSIGSLAPRWEPDEESDCQSHHEPLGWHVASSSREGSLACKKETTGSMAH